MQSRETEPSQVESPQIELSRFSQDQLDEKHENQPSSSDAEEASRLLPLEEKEEQPLKEKVEITIESQGQLSPQLSVPHSSQSMAAAQQLMPPATAPVAEEDRALLPPSVQHDNNLPAHALIPLWKRVFLSPYFLMHYVWTPAYLGMLIRDAVEFSTNPENRFGYEWHHLVFGKSLSPEFRAGHNLNNPFFLTSGLTTARVGDINYYWPTTLTMAVTLIYTLSSYLARYRMRNPADPIEFPKPWNYLVWLFSGYTFFRLFEIGSSKIAESIRLSQYQSECEANDRDFNFNIGSDDYACTLCGSWGTIDQPNSPQACLDLLLSEARNLNDMQNKLTRLVKHGGYQSMDFSHQNWTTWNSVARATLFETILNENRYLLDSVIFATTNSNTPIDRSTAEQIGRFVNQLYVRRVELSRFNLQNNSRIFIDHLIPESRFAELVMDGVQIGSESTAQLIRYLPGTAIQSLRFNRNGFNDTAFVELPDITPQTNVTALAVMDNPVGEGVVNIVRSANHSQLITVEIGNILVDADTLDSINQILCQIRLNQFKMIKASFEEPIFNKITPCFSNLTTLSLSDNGIDEEVLDTFPAWNVDMEYLDLSQNDLYNSVFSILRNKFQGRNVKTLILSGNELQGPEQMGELTKFIYDANTRVLDLSFCDLDDEEIIALCESYHPDSVLEEIRLGHNHISAVGAEKLFHTFKPSSVKIIDISYNALDDSVVDSLTQLNLDELDISGNPFTSAGVTRLLEHPNIQNLSRFSMANIPLNENAFDAIAYGLTDYNRTLNRLRSDELSYEVILQLSRLNPRARWEQLNLTGTGLSSQNVLPIARLLPRSSLVLAGIVTDFNLNKALPSYNQSSSQSNFAVCHFIVMGTVGMVLLTIFLRAIIPPIRSQINRCRASLFRPAPASPRFHPVQDEEEVQAEQERQSPNALLPQL